MGLKKKIFAVMENKQKVRNDMNEKEMMFLADTIKGEIRIMCVTDKLSELDTMAFHAKKNSEKLQNMIYDGRFKAESEE